MERAGVINVLYTQCIYVIFGLLRPNPPLTQTTLGQLRAALWDSQSWPAVIQPGIEPGSVVTPPALRCSALDLCATREPLGRQTYITLSYVR